RRFREVEAHLHAVGLELLDLEGDAAEDLAGLVVLDEEGGGGVCAGGGGGLAGEGDLLEGRRGELDGVAADDGAARVGNLDLEGKAGDRRLPVGGAGDEAEVGDLAGA